ncbi:MAG: NAD(P)H-binding protein [Myxococcales bacterium]
MIGVIGASGNVGSSLVRELAAAGQDVVAVSRSGGSGSGRVQHVAADLAEPGKVRDALRGVASVFLMIAGAGEGLDLGALVSAVADTGARRVVLLSSIGTRSRPTAMSHEPLRVLEKEVMASALAWTILRPGGFASNAKAWIPGIRARGVVEAPFGDIAIPVVDPADIASMASAALLHERHAGAVYELTGPAPISPRAQMHAIAEATGVPLTFVDLGRAQAAAAWRTFMPAAVIETTLDALGNPNELERRVSPDIERALGRPPRPFSAWAARNADAFRS